MTAAARRLQSLASLLAHVRERLGVDIGFVLWDGTTVPADLKTRRDGLWRSPTRARSRR